MRAILETAATGARKPVDPKTLDELPYIVSTLSDGFALNWLVFTDRTTAEQQTELVLSVLDTWMAANLGDAAEPATRVSTPPPEETLQTLVSWVSVK